MDELIKYTNYSKLKYNTKIKYFLYIIISIFVIFCVTIHNISMPYYYYNKSIVIKKNNNAYLKLIVLESDIGKILNNSVLITNGKKYNYEINYVSDVIMDNEFNKYYEIFIDSNVKNKIENNIFEVKIKYDEKLLNKIIYNFVTGR